MDRLYRQLRVRYPNWERKEEGEVNNTREGRIPPEKPVSFKGEKTVNWFQRQFLEQMSQTDEASKGGFAIAVAAAAYAISSSGREEQEGSLSKKKPVDAQPATSTKTKGKEESSTFTPTGRVSRWFSGLEGKEDEGSAGKLASLYGPEDRLQASLTKSKSKKDGGTAKPTAASRISRWFSGQEDKEDKEPTAGKSAATEKTPIEDSTVNQKKLGYAIITVPPIKKTPTFTDKHQNGMGSKRFASEKDTMTGQNVSAAVKNTSSLTDDRKLNLTTVSQKETKADVWEKAKIAKIKGRHEKLRARILEWENEKKKKAKRRLERIEGKLELRRAIASQEYRNEIARIDKIVAQARAAADEKRENDEHKTLERANEIRSTGKIPRESFCI